MSTAKMRLVSVAAALALLGAVPAVASAKTTITMSGSTSVAPLAALLARKYVKTHNVAFKLQQGGSDVGIADVAAGAVSIGNSSRDPKPGDPGGLVFNKIAHDAICITTNTANKVPGISQNGVQAIFGGDVRNWSGVPGSPRSGSIDVYVRTPASGTQDAFQKIFMGSAHIFSGATQEGSNGLIQQRVHKDKSGIGYVSLFFAKTNWAIPYAGVPCTLRNAKSGQYGGLRNFYMVTRGKPHGAVKTWIGWIRHSKAARRIIATQWVPLS